MQNVRLNEGFGRNSKLTHSDFNFIAHRNVSNNLQKEIERAKTNYEQNLVHKGHKAVFKYTRTSLSSQVSIPLVRDDSGSIFYSNQDCAKCFATIFQKNIY